MPHAPRWPSSGRSSRTSCSSCASALLALPGSLASQARIDWLKPLAAGAPGGELCLFVTHAAAPGIKLHVTDHVLELAAAGVAVVLIINTDLAADRIELPAQLLIGGAGLHRPREPGLRFRRLGALYALLDTRRVERLFLVNDSIVGPLDGAAFAAMITRVRAQDADMVGLTQNPYPKWHLQSFFLVFNHRLLRSQVLADLMRHVVNLSTKEAVINTYEIQISEFLVSRGFRCEAVFPNLEPGSPLPDDTYFRWSQLVASGFPYIKASILGRSSGSPGLPRWCPCATWRPPRGLLSRTGARAGPGRRTASGRRLLPVEQRLVEGVGAV